MLAMSFRDLFRPRSPRVSAVDHLAEATGSYATLAQNLARHAAICELPTIAAELPRLAEAAKERAEELRRMLRDRGVWPAPPFPPTPDGPSNWERLTSDLALQTELFGVLNQSIVEVEATDPDLAAALRKLAEKEDRNLGILRDLALKCDPQALD